MWTSVRRFLTAAVDAITENAGEEDCALGGGDVNVTREAGMARNVYQRVPISGPELRNRFPLNTSCDDPDTLSWREPDVAGPLSRRVRNSRGREQRLKLWW